MGFSPESLSASCFRDPLRFRTRLAMFKFGSWPPALFLELMCLLSSHFKTWGRSSLDECGVFEAASELLEASGFKLCSDSTAPSLPPSSSSLTEPVGRGLSKTEVLTCRDCREGVLSEEGAADSRGPARSEVSGLAELQNLCVSFM